MSAYSRKLMLVVALIVALAASLGGLRPAAHAAPEAVTYVTVEATDTGWYDSTGYHETVNDNYIAGNFFVDYWHDFFVFDLSGLSGVLTGATLEVDSGDCPYDSPDSSETWRLYDVSTPLGTLTGGTGGVAAYTDLGSGTTYGSSVFDSSIPSYTPVSVPLNASGIAAIQAALGGGFGIGGAVTTLNGLDDTEFVLGCSEGGRTQQLVLEFGGARTESLARQGTCELKTIDPVVYFGIDNTFEATGIGLLESLRFSHVGGGVEGWLLPLSVQQQGNRWTATFANARLDGTIAIPPGEYRVFCFGPSGSEGNGLKVEVIK